MAQFFQWVATADEVLIALGETPRAGATAEVVPSSRGRGEFWVVEKLNGPGVGSGYSRDAVKAFKVTEIQMRNFFTNKGETLPASIEIFVRSSIRGGLLNDQIVVVDSSMTITRL